MPRHVFRQHPGALPTSAVRWLLRSGAAVIVVVSGLLLAGLASIGDDISASSPAHQTADERKASEPSLLSGRVIEKDGGKPVAGAAVTIAWSDAMAGWTGPNGEIPPPVLGENTTRTDGDGRYRLPVPPERIADRPIGHLVVRVGHPDFVPRRWDVGGVYRFRESQKPIPDTVALQRGVEYHAQVVRTDGKPAAAVPYEFSNWISEGNAELKGRTDAGGRIRLRMPKASALAITIPRGDDTAPFEKFWGVDHRPTRPGDYAPADLGVIRLGPGLTLSGRVLDLAGKPIGGQPLMLTGRYNRGPRVAVTDAEGRFRFSLLRPGNYEIQGEGPDEHFIGCPVPRQSLDLNRVIRPIDLYLREGMEPAPVELREAETVLIQVRIEGVRSELPSGAFPKAAVGGRGDDPFYPFREQVSVYGFLPNSAGVDRPDPGPGMDFSGPGAKTVINDAPPDTRYGISWSVSGHADAEGRVVLRALKGLRHTRLWVRTQGLPRAYKTRLGPGSPWRDTGGGWLGTLESDHRAITVHSYYTATVVATIRTEEGEPPPADAQAQVDFLQENFIDGLDTSPYMEPEERRVGPDLAVFEKEANGRFRCKYLMPDHEYAFFARATGYVPLRIEHRSVHQGNEVRLTLVMRKAPKPPAVGTPAPAFTVPLLGGRSLSLGELRGKFVLVHFWLPVFLRERNQIEPLRAVHDRFGKDDRLVVLGFCLANNPEGVARVIRAQRITWPQTVLRDGFYDPIAQNYPQTGALLIGPDGRVVARDLTGEKIGEAVARALGGR
jgi:protocatechuate 3,4-dioxygenase beta subunit